MRKLTLSFLCILAFMSLTMAQWQVVNPGTTNTGQKLKVVSSSKAVFTTTKSEIFVTADGGETWDNKAPEGIPAKILSNVDFADETHGLIGVADTFLLKSANGGDSWQVIDFTTIAKNIDSNYGPADGSLRKLTAVATLDASTYFATLTYKDASSTYRAYMLKTTDAGANWDSVGTEFANGTSIYFNGIDFYDNSLGFAIGSKGTFLKTTNGGTSWDKVTFDDAVLAAASINDIKIINADSILLATNKGIALTKDGCATFEFITSSSSFDVELVMDSVLFVGATTANCARSLNYGTSWETANNGLGGSVFDLTIFNDKIYALSTKGNMYVANNFELLDLGVSFEISEQVGNVITINNSSENCGSYQWNMGDGNALISDVNSYTYLDTGIYDVVLKGSSIMGDSITNAITVTVDSIAVNWAARNFTTNTLSKLAVVNDSTAILTASNTVTGYTVDNGASFTMATIPDSLYGHNNYDIQFIDDTTAIASYMSSSKAEYINGFVLKTIDAGKTWNPIALDSFSSNTGISETDIAAGVKPSFYAACKLNTEMAYVSARWQVSNTTSEGYAGAIFKTSDKGETWEVAYDTLYNTYAGVINAIKFTQDGSTGYIAGVKLLHKTSDSGATWTSIPADDFGSINDVLMYNADTVFLATQKGVVKTTDGFYTWSIVNSDMTFDVIAINDSTLISGRNNSSMKFSSDFGETWSIMSNGITATCFELEFFANNVWALSSKGRYFVTPLKTFYQPEVAFNYTANASTVTFENLSSNAQSYEWDFGNGETSTEFAPVYTYPENGSFVVTLTATMEGNSASVSDTIIIDTEAPVFDLCPNDTTITLAKDETEIAVTWVEPTITDNISDTVSLTKTHESGATFGIGTTTVTYTATDAEGNSSTCSFTVEIVEYVSVNDNLNAACIPYPNPSSNGAFSLNLPESATSTTVQIIDLNGKAICTYNTAKTGIVEFNQQLENGMYIISVKTDLEKVSYSKLIVK